MPANQGIFTYFSACPSLRYIRFRRGSRPSSSELPFDLPWIVIDSCKAADFRWKPERTLVSILDEIAVPVRAHSDWLSLCAPDQ